jgi:4-hydroxy-L-threonine phosphate dehydrogenase PdxA
MRRKLRLVLTPGDPEGIGPEVTWKTLKMARIPKNVEILCVGAVSGFKKLRAPIVPADSPLALAEGMPRRSKPFVWLVPAPETAPQGRHLAGYQSGWAIERAVTLIQNGLADALVTGPISKEHLQAGGFPFNGHTDLLAKLGGASSVTMMLANPTLRVSLVTTHVPLSKVPEKLTAAELRRAVLPRRRERAVRKRGTRHSAS